MLATPPTQHPLRPDPLLPRASTGSAAAGQLRLGENGSVSNPYAPPDDRPSPSAAPETPESGPGHRPGPEAGWGIPPAHRPAAPPPHDPPPPDPAKVATIVRSTRTFAALMLAAVLTSSFPVPWQAAGLVFTVLALVVGVRALVQAVRAHVRGALTGMLVGGVGLSAFWLVVSVAMSMMWPVYLERQDCLAGALTITARQECEAQFEDSMDEWMKRFETRR